MSKQRVTPRSLLADGLGTLGLALRAAARASWAATCHVARLCEEWLFGAKRAQYGLAVTRILLGVMIMGVVLTNLPTVRYTFGAGGAWNGQLERPLSDFATIFPFSIVNQAARFDMGIYLVMIGLFVCGALLMIGYRTHLVMIPLFILWVGFLSINTLVQDQSDNLTRISFLALFFTALSNRWSVDSLRRSKNADMRGNPVKRLWRFQQVFPDWFTTLIHNLAVLVLICQLCFVYGSGGLFKASGLPWQNGTAVYAPIHTERFGTWPTLSDLVTAWGPLVAIATIGTVLVQVSFPFLMVNRFTRIFGLLAILLFHVAIGVLMGLPWFSLSMLALDSIFIRDKTWRKLTKRFRLSWNARRERRKPSPEVGALPDLPELPEDDAETDGDTPDPADEPASPERDAAPVPL